MTTGLERAQVLRFPAAPDVRPAPTSDDRTARRLRRRLGAVLAVRLAARRSPHRAVAGHQAAAVRAAPPARRARDVHDAAIARGIAPPF